MGSHAVLDIGGVCFDSWKDGVDPAIMVLFSESEKQCTRDPVPPEAKIALDEGEEWPFYEVQYRSTVQVIKKRLEFFGFTLDVAHRAFEIAKQEEIKDIQRSIKVWLDRADSLEAAHSIIARYRRGLELVSSADFDSWMEAIREAYRSPLSDYPNEIRTLADYFQPVLRATGDARFPGSVDPRFRLRLELEAATTDQVVLDISELVNDGEYYSISSPMTEYARDELPSSERERCHMVILTEGSTDQFYLERAFALFHPELTNYVSFLDFDGWNVPGGASFLESMIRSFIAAGIKDRIVAIFDNDTAGFASHQRLAQLALPSNIRVLRYPDIDLAKSYPTLGPSGTVVMDVNGLAASIELYLGEDIIRNGEGDLIPIQWKGYDSSLTRYQGEITDKRGCWKRFSEKLAKVSASCVIGKEPEWRDLLLVANTLCTAFAVQDGEELIRLAAHQGEEQDAEIEQSINGPESREPV
jgi:hypothetical protein